MSAYYHGSHAELGEGELIDGPNGYAYFTTSLSVAVEIAADRASWAGGVNDGRGFIYEIEPIGDAETDPEYDAGVSFKSVHPLRVIGLAVI